MRCLKMSVLQEKFQEEKSEKERLQEEEFHGEKLQEENVSEGEAS